MNKKSIRASEEKRTTCLEQKVGLTAGFLFVFVFALATDDNSQFDDDDGMNFVVGWSNRFAVWFGVSVCWV